MTPDEIARLTITHLTREPINVQKAIARQPDETNAAYAARMQALADGSAGAVRLILVNRIASRQTPDDNPDLTPIETHVIPFLIP